MAYSKQTWADGEAGGTPLSAARLNHVEDGIEAAATTADTAQSGLAGKSDTSHGHDHGSLTGLADDDHTQYHNDARGDLRYYTQAQVDAAIADAIDTRATRLYHSTDQTLTNAAVTSIQFDSEVFDSKGLHGTPNNIITVDRTGKWRVFGQIRFAANATADRNVYVRVNGVTIFTGMAWGNSTVQTLVPFDDVLNLTAGDEVEILARQDSGGDLAVQGGQFASLFGVHYLGS